VSLRWRLGLIGAAYVLVTLLGGLATLVAAQHWSSALDDRREWLIASEQAARLRATYIDQETGQRGFVITGRDDFLEPYERGHTEAEPLVAALETLEAKDRHPLPISGVEQAVEEWRSEAEREITAVRAGNQQLADALVSAGTGRARFDIVRDRLDRLDAAINTRLEDIRTAVDAGRISTARAFMLTVGVALVVTAVAAFLIRRWLMVPLSSITAAVRRIRAGEDAELTPHGPPELRQVATAVDEMQRTIRQQRDDAIRAREAIEQSAILAVQVRSALTSDLGDYPTGWTMAAGLRPAEGVVAGDCYDVTLISPTTIAVIVLDIAGHGAQSAVAALKCKELLKAALRSGLDPGPAVSWLSEQEHGLGELFVTAFLAVIDTESGRGLYANAGHPHALLARGGQLERLGPTGPIVGPFVTTWQSASMVVDPGGKLIIYTDGLVEARDAARAFYGESRLIDLLLTLDCPEAQPVVDHILGDLDDFHPGRLADDVTIVVACRAPTSDAVSEPALSLGTAAAAAGSPALTSRIDDDVRAEQTVR
jgi:sigma-B regulation protein RsbU (phosphoserine phosphatase)